MPEEFIPEAENGSDKLKEFQGKWVALSRTDRRVIAARSTLAELAAHVQESGGDLGEVVVHRVIGEDEDYIKGGAEIEIVEE